MTLGDISKSVEDQLRERGSELSLGDSSVLHDLSFEDEEGLWHVFIENTTGRDVRGRFYDVLNDVEEWIEKQHQVKVMLVPVKSETAAPTYLESE